MFGAESVWFGCMFDSESGSDSVSDSGEGGWVYARIVPRG